MKNVKSLLALLLVVSMVAALFVGAASAEGLTYAEGTVLRMATGYNNAKTGLFFNAEVAGEGITLADGNTYNAGDLKPTWVEVQNVLNVFQLLLDGGHIVSQIGNGCFQRAANGVRFFLCRSQPPGGAVKILLFQILHGLLQIPLQR